MKYSDTTSKQGIIQYCELYTNKGDAGISGDTTLLRRFNGLINETGREVRRLILKYGGGWLYDDSNQTDLPQATTDLVSGTAKYSIDAEALTIKRVEVANEDGDWTRLKPLNLSEINIAVDEFFETDGDPIYYRLVDSTIELFPAPDYSETGGLKVYFDRDQVDFAYDATDTEPGFPSLFHELLPLGASIKYLKVTIPADDRIPQLQQDYQNLLAQVPEYFAYRFEDNKSRVRRKFKSYK